MTAIVPRTISSQSFSLLLIAFPALLFLIKLISPTLFPVFFTFFTLVACALSTLAALSLFFFTGVSESLDALSFFEAPAALAFLETLAAPAAFDERTALEAPDVLDFFVFPGTFSVSGICAPVITLATVIPCIVLKTKLSLVI